jgi:hypothetical protein
LIKAVLDEVVPADVAGLLSGTDLRVEELPARWRGLSDTELLLTLTTDGYDWLITCDKRMPYQQNLARTTVAVLVLPTQLLPEIDRMKTGILRVLSTPLKGNFVVIDRTGKLLGKPAPHFQGR